MARPAGSANKSKNALRASLRERFGDDFCAVHKIADQAIKLEELADADLDVASRKAALDGWDKLAQYIEPKLKAIEMSGPDDESGLPTAIKIEIVKSGA